MCRDLYIGVISTAPRARRPVYILSATKMRIWKIYMYKSRCWRMRGGKKSWSLWQTIKAVTQTRYVQMMIEHGADLCSDDQRRNHSRGSQLLTSCPSRRQSGSANCSRVALRTSHGFYTICCHLMTDITLGRLVCDCQSACVFVISCVIVCDCVANV